MRPSLVIAAVFGGAVLLCAGAVVGAYATRHAEGAALDRVRGLESISVGTK